MARVAQCLQVLAVVVFTDAPWFYVVYLIAAIGSESLPTTSCHTWQARQACAAHALLKRNVYPPFLRSYTLETLFAFVIFRY